MVVPTTKFSFIASLLAAVATAAPALRMSRAALFIAWLVSLVLVLYHASSLASSSASASSKPPSLSCSLCRRILRDISRDVARTSGYRLAETVIETDETTGEEREIPYEVRSVRFRVFERKASTD